MSSFSGLEGNAVTSRREKPYDELHSGFAVAVQASGTNVEKVVSISLSLSSDGVGAAATSFTT